MTPLDLTNRPPRSCYVQLDGLMLMPRTIDKMRALLPGGVPNGYFINLNDRTKGLSGYLLARLGITEDELCEAIARADSEDDIAAWLRTRVDANIYPSLNEALKRIELRHAENPELVREFYAQVIASQPELRSIVDIIDADDRRLFPQHFAEIDAPRSP